MLVYFKDTLANVGLPEAWREWDLNDVTQIDNNCFKCDSNRIRQNVSRILSTLWVKSGRENWVESSRKPWVKLSQENLIRIPSKNLNRINLVKPESNPVKNRESNKVVKTWVKSRQKPWFESIWKLKLLIPAMGIAAVNKMWQWAGYCSSGRAFAVHKYRGDARYCRCNHRNRRRLVRVRHDSM